MTRSIIIFFFLLSDCKPEHTFFLKKKKQKKAKQKADTWVSDELKSKHRRYQRYPRQYQRYPRRIDWCDSVMWCDCLEGVCNVMNMVEWCSGVLTSARRMCKTWYCERMYKTWYCERMCKRDIVAEQLIVK